MAQSWYLKNTLSNEAQEIELWTRESAKFCPPARGWEVPLSPRGALHRWRRAGFGPCRNPMESQQKSTFGKVPVRDAQHPPLFPSRPQETKEILRTTLRCRAPGSEEGKASARGRRCLKLCRISWCSQPALLGKTVPRTCLTKS